MRRVVNSLPPVLASAMVVVLACGSPPTPDFSTLELRMTYDELAALAGGQCEHVHDRGVRVLQWHYRDGSVIEAGIHDGGLSGLNVLDSAASPGRTMARRRADGTGLQADMPEKEVRSRLGDHAVTTSDASDRECRWTYRDGTLTAVFMRGKLEDASWLRTYHSEPEILVSVSDPVAMLLADLASENEWDRARALQELDGVDDPRLADAFLGVLRIETGQHNRTIAAGRLAEMGDTRASDLLLADLERDIVSEEILRVLGIIGDARADAALARAYQRVSSPRTKSRIEIARAKIQQRHDLPPSN